MIYWRVRFDGPVLGEGWLARDANGEPVGLFHDDGTPASEVTNYTTLDTDPTPPAWAE